MKKIIKVSDKNTAVAGGGASTPDDIASMINDGAKFISYGPDYSLLARAAKEGVDAFNGITRN
jgi:2-keto-3-deoxy-L-rhamnonate aldolase RhmA